MKRWIFIGCAFFLIAFCLWTVLMFRPDVPTNVYESEYDIGIVESSIYRSKDFGVIWSFVFLNDHQVLMSQRQGKLKLVNIQNNTEVNIDLPFSVRAVGQGGLLDIALHPEFPKKPWVYFTYSVAQDNFFETRVSRARFVDNQLSQLEVLYTSNSQSSKGQHFGSRIAFDHKGHMFFGVGDRGLREQAQDLTQSGGKIYRLMEDGSIPLDNPFMDQDNIDPRIWSYGHRNPQGIAFDLKTKTLWITEHGPRGGDELNKIMKGGNYGWPLVTYGKEYSGLPVGNGIKQAEGMESPVHFYVPSIAPAGLLIYRGHQYPGYNGAFIIPALVQKHINVVRIGPQKVWEERWLESIDRRFRHVAVDPKGYIWASTDTSQLMRILPKGYVSTGVVPTFH